MAVAGAEIKIFSAPLHWTSTDLSVRTLLLDGIRRTGEAGLVMLVSWALKIQPINQLPVPVIYQSINQSPFINQPADYLVLLFLDSWSTMKEGTGSRNND